MKKAELQEHRDTYDAAMSIAHDAESNGYFVKAVEASMAAWPYITGMMQYRTRFEEAEFRSVAAIDLPLKYAPLLFRSDVLERLAELLKVERSIDRRASADLAENLAKAKQRLWLNHKLFSTLEENPGIRQDTLRTRMGGDQDYWRGTSEVWERMGLLRRWPEANSYRLALTTRLGEVVKAKCRHCGATAEAPKAMFLDEIRCAKCRKSSWFVFTAIDKGN